MIPCTRCNSTGLVERDGVEKDVDLHPILSQQKTICPDCGGGGAIEPSRKAMIDAAKAASGD